LIDHILWESELTLPVLFATRSTGQVWRKEKSGFTLWQPINSQEKGIISRKKILAPRNKWGICSTNGEKTMNVMVAVKKYDQK
jgi:hypothetical protein